MNIDRRWFLYFAVCVAVVFAGFHAARYHLLKQATHAVEERNKNLTLDGMSGLDAKERSIEMGDVSLGMAKLERGDLKEGLKLQEIWKDERTKRILVVGEAGSGKTTLLKYFAKTDLWKQFKLKIYVALRLVKDAKSLEDVVIFGALGGREDLRESVRVLLACMDPKETLWIMDGWDEISVETGSVLSEIQKGQHKLVEYMLAGSRPEAKLSVLCDNVVENQGFRKSEYLAGEEDPFVREMGWNPLMLRLITMVNQKVTSKTQLYKMVVDRALEGLKIRKALQKVAWNGFMKRKLVLSAEELSEAGTDLQRSGLLREESVQVFGWVHQTFQEYLAAEYACHQLENVGKTLRELREKLGEKSDVFFGFVCGIGGNANAHIAEWFPIEFMDVEFGFVGSKYAQVGWLSEGNDFVEKLFDERLTNKLERLLLLKNAVHYGQVGAVKYFLKRCEPNFSEELRVASRNGHAEIVRLLLEDGRADPAADNNRAIRQASENGYPEVVRLLLKRANVGSFGAVFEAYARRDTVSVLELLRQNPVESSADDNWLLVQAAYQGHADIVQVLLRKSIPRLWVTDAMRIAASNAQVEVVRVLLEHGRADPRPGLRVAKTAAMKKFLSDALEKWGTKWRTK